MKHKLKLTIVVESPLDHEATQGELIEFQNAMNDDPDPLISLLEHNFDLTIENHKEGA